MQERDADRFRLGLERRLEQPILCIAADGNVFEYRGPARAGRQLKGQENVCHPVLHIHTVKVCVGNQSCMSHVTMAADVQTPPTS